MIISSGLELNFSTFQDIDRIFQVSLYALSNPLNLQRNFATGRFMKLLLYLADGIVD